MSAQELQSERPPGAGATYEIPARHDYIPPVEPPGPSDIPPAFYRDDEVPPPPPGDPHWREWPYNQGPEPIPRSILIGLPLVIGAVGVFHIMAILLVLHFSGLY